MILDDRCEADRGLDAQSLAWAADRIRQHRLRAINMPSDWGGQALSTFDQVIVQSARELHHFENVVEDLVALSYSRLPRALAPAVATNVLAGMSTGSFASVERPRWRMTVWVIRP